MKKILLIAVVFITAIGFSQDRQKNQDMRQNIKQERQNISAEQRAETTVKRLTEILDLNDVQQKQILEVHLDMAKKRTNGTIAKNDRAKMEEMKKDYRNKMKQILNKKQFDIWSNNQQGKRGN